MPPHNDHFPDGAGQPAPPIQWMVSPDWIHEPTRAGFRVFAPAGMGM
jgi:hypothetical protein